MRPRVVVIGDLLYDLLARVDEVEFGTDTFAEIEATPGGSGANAAVWMAASGLDVHFVGRVGDDPLGHSLAADLESRGVTTHLVLDPELPTGKVFVLVDGAGERTMITARGASEALAPEDLSPDLLSGGHLHLSGYTFSGTARRETALRALEAGRAAGMTVSVDPSAVPLLRRLGREHFLADTRDADLVFPNEGEGAFLAGASDPDEILDALLAGYGAVVLKLGPRGAVYADRTGLRLALSSGTLEEHPAGSTDSTGAGDAMCAGFLASWLAGGSPADALADGISMAAASIRTTGGRPVGDAAE